MIEAIDIVFLGLPFYHHTLQLYLSARYFVIWNDSDIVITHHPTCFGINRSDIIFPVHLIVVAQNVWRDKYLAQSLQTGKRVCTGSSHIKTTRFGLAFMFHYARNNYKACLAYHPLLLHSDEFTCR